MAKVTGPLFSRTASGNWKKILIYTSAKRISIVKKFFISKDPQTEEQTEQRNLYSEGVTSWNSLTEEQKEYWGEESEEKGITGFNLFMREYLNTGGFPVTYGLYNEGIYGVDVYYPD